MALENGNVYNKLPADHEAVEKYEPSFIARGGDHLVYEVKGHPDTVIKTSTYKIKDVLLDSANRGLPFSEISPEMRGLLESEVTAKNNQISQLRQYFGSDHTLSERRMLMQVPVSQEIIEEIFKDDWEKRKSPVGAEDANEAWTIAIVQKKTREIENPEHLGLSYGGFIEERKIQPEEDEMKRLNEAFLGRKEITTEDLELFFQTQDNPKNHVLADLVEKSKQDQALKEKAIAFVSTAMKYAQETNNILALAGEDNVILYPKDEGWEYLLVDAIPLPNNPVFTDARLALEKEKEGEELSREENGAIIRAKNFTRAMNGLAAALGMPERIEL